MRSPDESARAATSPASKKQSVGRCLSAPSLVAWCLLGTLSAGLPCVVQAQRAKKDEVSAEEGNRAARALFDAGTIAFRQARYEDALNSFEQAHRLTNDPVLLFNVATTLDRLRRDGEAVRQFRAYLEAMPDAPNRAAVEARIELLAQGDTAQPAAPAVVSQPAKSDSTPAGTQPDAAPDAQPGADDTKTAAPTVQTSEGREGRNGLGLLPSWMFWTGLGVTAVVGGVALWSGLDTLSAASDYEDNPTRKAYNDGEGLEKRTNILIATAAGAGVLTAVVGILTDWRGSSSQRTAAGHRSWGAWANGAGAGANLKAVF